MDSYIKDFKGLGVLQLNCRSYYGKKDEIHKLLGNWNILTFSETWLKDKHDDSMVNWPDKNCFRLDRTHKNGGGVMCMVPTELAPYCNINK